MLLDGEPFAKPVDLITSFTGGQHSGPRIYSGVNLAGGQPRVEADSARAFAFDDVKVMGPCTEFDAVFIKWF